MRTLLIMPLHPGDRLGPYSIQSLLGEGGMGEVRSTSSRRTRSTSGGATPTTAG